MKLSYRISLLILIVIALSSLAHFMLTQYHEKKLHEDSENILVETVVQSLRDALIQDVIDGNKLRVTNLLKSIVKRDNPIEYIYVTDSQYNVFAHSFELGFPRYLVDRLGDLDNQVSQQLIHKYQTDDALIFEYSEVLLPGLDTTLHLGINQTDITDRLAENTQHILLISLVSIILALVIASIWGRQITRPLDNFIHNIQRFGSGEEVDFRPSSKHSVEIRRLASAFQKATQERQEALTSLKAREQDLLITLNSIGDAVVTTDKDGLVTRMNPTAEILTGWSINQARGQPLKTVFPIINASTRETIENPVDKVLDTGKTVFLSNHTTLIARNGEEYQIADSAAPIRNENDQIMGVVLVFNDVTEKYQLRLQRDKQLERFKELSNMALTLSGDPQDVFNKVTSLIGRLLGVRVVCLSKIIDGKLDFLSVYVDGKTQSNVGQCKLDVSPCSNVEKDRDIRIFHQVTDLFPEASFLREHNAFTYCGFPALDSNGQVVAVTCLLHDEPHEFTEDDQDLLRIFGQRIGMELEHMEIQNQLIKQEEQLRHTQKMDALGKLTGGIAHDYNNMLGVVIGYAELLQSALDDQPKLARYASEIYRAGKRGAKLTNKLLGFSRKKSSDAKVLNINQQLRDEQQMLERTLTVRIQLALDLADELWPVLLDSSDLEDAVINMAINAMHAMKTAGALTIRTRNTFIDDTEAHALQLAPGDYVQLSISDTGCGMDQHVMERIFDPFYSTKGDQGTGLGLSQVYGFVERSNGSIKVYSEPGQGTRFDLYFPRYPDNEKPDNHQAEYVAKLARPGEKESILMVDDEQALLDLAFEILDSQGYKVHCAASAKQALEILEHEPVDVLVSDVLMPGMDGHQLVTIVMEKYPNIKTQLASGFTDDHRAGAGDDISYQSLLYKPYSAQTLLTRIQQLLDA